MDKNKKIIFPFNIYSGKSNLPYTYYKKLIEKGYPVIYLTLEASEQGMLEKLMKNLNKECK